MMTCMGLEVEELAGVVGVWPLLVEPPPSVEPRNSMEGP